MEFDACMYVHVKHCVLFGISMARNHHSNLAVDQILYLKKASTPLSLFSYSIIPTILFSFTFLSLQSNIPLILSFFLESYHFNNQRPLYLSFSLVSTTHKEALYNVTFEQINAANNIFFKQIFTFLLM